MIGSLPLHQVRDFAFDVHGDQRYGMNLPYRSHLLGVHAVASQYLSFVERHTEDVIRAVWCHDLLEDCNLSYSDLEKKIGTAAADIVYNVTNELGKTRKERAERTYPKIVRCPLSTFVKLCDRISNVRFSYFTGTEDSMFKKYKQEHFEFKAALYKSDFDEMFRELEMLFALGGE